MLGRLLLAGAVMWPAALGAAWWHRAEHPGPAIWPAAVYLAAGTVCHQRPERSFHTADVVWPVCARCAGLYLAAPLGAGAMLIRGSRFGDRARVLKALAVAAIPTALTLAWEWSGAGPSTNVARFASALPLGAMVAATLIHVTHRVD